MDTISPFDNVEFPSLDELPFRKDDPEYAIWGFYEHISRAPEGHKDEFGALNLLTPARIAAASKEEIQCGKVCSLNWELHKPFPAGNGRRGFEQKVLKLGGFNTADDELSMNTQSGSQWDGFRHWGYYKTGEFYNGLKESEIVDKERNGVPLPADRPMRNGIHGYQGKIVGRGVLLDYYSWAKTNGIHYLPHKQHLVTASELDRCVHSQDTSFRQGDILFIRMGYTDWYENATREERTSHLTAPMQAVGLRQGQEEIEWLWNHHFAAVASDSPAFEARPTVQKWDLHEYLLPLWGTPIGEMFDLEDLAKTCKELGRYSFFVTSSPLNVINGIASPPNALAIF